MDSNLEKLFAESQAIMKNIQDLIIKSEEEQKRLSQEVRKEIATMQYKTAVAAQACHESEEGTIVRKQRYQNEYQIGKFTITLADRPD